MDNSSPNSFTIIQWNARSISNKLDQLNNFLINCNVDLVLLNETWLSTDRTIKIKGYNIIRQDSDHPHGGVAIAIKSTYSFLTIPTISTYDFQNILVEINTGIKVIDILCCYSPPPPNGKFKISNLIVPYSKIRHKDFLIIGDFNAHQVAWGCRRNDSRGSSIQSFIEDHNIICLNDHNLTTLAPFGNTGNVLDLVLSSLPLSSSCSFEVLDDPMSSNHYPILVSIAFPGLHNKRLLKPQQHVICSNKLNNNILAKMDWKEFAKKCDETFLNFSLPVLPDNNINYNNIYNLFVNQIYNIISDICISKNPKSPNGNRSQIRLPKAWWNERCSIAVRQARLALQSYKFSPSLENYLIYKKMDALKKKILFEEKRSSWANLCSSFNRCTPIKAIWDHIRRFKHAKCNNQHRISDFISRNSLAYLNKVVPTQQEIKEVSLTEYFDSAGLNSFHWIHNEFSIDELLAALSNKRNTTPGPDGIPYIIIINLPLSTKKILLNIYNILWSVNEIPLDWKTQYIVPVPKPNSEQNSLSAYRPISLTSCFSKTFESMLKNRLEWLVEKSMLIPMNQYGFRRGKSTMDNLGCIIGEVKNAFEHNSILLAVFVDFKGAFDNIDHVFLVKSLYQLGFPGKIINWIFKFLHKRSASVKVNGMYVGPTFACKGTPQGSVISPLIFILSLVYFMNQIPDSVNYLLYADDLVLYLQCDSLNDGQLINYE